MMNKFARLGSVLAIFVAGALAAGCITWNVTTSDLVSRQLVIIDKAAKGIGEDFHEPQRVRNLLFDVHRQVAWTGHGGKGMTTVVIGCAAASILFFVGIFLGEKGIKEDKKSDSNEK
jgi:hypothetical protein